jgi:hypothetical protein
MYVCVGGGGDEIPEQIDDLNVLTNLYYSFSSVHFFSAKKLNYFFSFFLLNLFHFSKSSCPQQTWYISSSDTGGPRYKWTFYLRIRFFTLEKRSKMTIFQSKMDFLSGSKITERIYRE